MQKVHVAIIVETAGRVYPVVNIIVGTAGRESNTVGVLTFRFGQTAEKEAEVGEPFRWSEVSCCKNRTLIWVAGDVGPLVSP